MTLFHPGQSSRDGLRTPIRTGAYRKVIAGVSCMSRHEGNEKEIGGLIVSGKKFELAPIMPMIGARPWLCEVVGADGPTE